MIIYQILYAAICIMFAYLNTGWIKDGKKIEHAWNGLLHIVFAAAAYWAFDWEAIIISLLNGRVVFDLALNKFRGLELDYVSKSPKSIIDRIERKIFGDDGVLPKIVYVFISIVFNVIYFIE